MNKEERLKVLKEKANYAFDTHIENLLSASAEVIFPLEDLTEQEFKELNTLLSEQGIRLVEVKTDDKWRSAYLQKIEKEVAPNKGKRLEELKSKASKNFEIYMNAALEGRTDYPLPASRMTKQEWQELNKLLEDKGIKLLEFEHGDGKSYMHFIKTEKKKTFEKAAKNIATSQPQNSDDIIIEIVENNFNSK